MAKSPTFSQRKKYDIAQKIVTALADAESRAILFSTVRTARTAGELADRLRIPQSSAYKKIAELEELALIRVDSREITDDGHRVRRYKSRVKSAEILIRGTEPRISLAPN